MKKFYFFTIVLLLVSTGIGASNTYLQKSDYQDAYSAGNGKIHIKQLIFAEGDSHNYFAGLGGKCKGDESDKGKVVEGSNAFYLLGGERYTIITFEADNDNNKPGKNKDMQRDEGWVKLTVVRGVIQVTNDYAGLKPLFTPEDGEQTVTLKRLDSGDHLTYLEYDWFPPEVLDAKQFALYSGITRHRSSEKDPWSRCEFLLGTFEGADPDMAPMLTDPFFYPSNESGAAGYGYLAMVYNNIQNTYRYYTSEDAHVYPCDDNSGILYIDARDTVLPGYRVCFESLRSTDNVTKHWVWSNRVDVPAYHQIHDLEVGAHTYYREDIGKWYADHRYRRLTWKIYYPAEQDIMDGDMFEIQRAYSSDFSDAETIETISMEYDSLMTDSLLGFPAQTYSYTDSASAAWWNPTENNNQIYYRVRRVSSSSWGWDGHNYAVSKAHSPSHAYNLLPFAPDKSPQTYTKDADFENNRQVHLQLRLRNLNGNKSRTESSPGYQQGIWDSKQKLILRKVLVELNDTIDIEIPQDSIRKAIEAVYYAADESTYINQDVVIRYTDLANTPCVHYEYIVMIDTTGATIPRVLSSTEFGPIAVVAHSSEEGEIYYTEAANISTFSGSHKDYSDCVLLTWEPTEGNVGTYMVEARYNNTVKWDTLATGLTDSWYRDYYADPALADEWQYRLTMSYACNCNLSQSSAETTGSRNPYGKVSGRIQFEDGTGCPDITVTASRVSDGEVVQSVKTDETGAYLLDSLLYGGGVEYAITPTSQSAQFRYNNTSATYATIGLGLKNSIAEGVDFENISTVRFSGRVLYENSTIPARDVNFLVNGLLVKRGNTVVKTDASGNFEFNVPSGAGFTVQAVKDGHWFAGEGYVRIDGDSVLTLTKALDGVRIYDATKVRLIGRLAGGKNQADKPLGFGQSTNNLGDDLKMVFELEGDNISQIVHIPDDLTKDTLEFAVDSTKIHFSKKRIIIEPDATTGEYAVDLFPVKYKITQATAKGYATLFAEGRTGETLDLTAAPTSEKESVSGNDTVRYNESYCITYHSPINISCTQLLYGAELPFLGEKTMRRQSINNEMVDVPLAQKQADGSYTYLFGAPVFKSQTYQFRVTAHEDYYYNNDPASLKHEEVRIEGGTLKVYNGMHDAENTTIETKALDANGQADISVPIDYVSFLKTGENALRVLDLSVEYEGDYVEYQAIRGYVTGNRAKGKDFLTSTHGKVEILDILRDPPGSKSYAWIEQGTTYKWNYTYDFNFKFGLKIDLGYGTQSNSSMGVYAGTPAGGSYAGYNNNLTNMLSFSLPIQTSYLFKRAAYYTFTTSDKIETSNDSYYVGERGDVYIGLVQNMYMGVTDAVKPIDSLTYATLSNRDVQGAMKRVAEGISSDGQKYYLVIGRETEVGSYVDATFYYTHDYITGTLLPKLVRERNNLLMMGDSATLQAIANAQQKAVYMSLVSADDEMFGYSTDYYKILTPENTDKLFADEVDSYNRLIANWADVLISNESEKINAIYGQNAEEVGTWSVSGGTKTTHTESYDFGNTYTQRVDYPGFSLNAGQGLIGALKFFETGNEVIAAVLDNQWKKLNNRNPNPYVVTVDMINYKFKYDFTPILDFNFDRDPNHTETHNKKAGFTLQPDSYGYMDVSVRRVVNKKDDFNSQSDNTRQFLDDGKEYNDQHLYGSYVYYLNGGASRCPWEKADSTQYYEPKMPLGNGTLSLENQRLDIDVHERSNVPADQPAIFHLRMTNEGDNPYGGGAAPITFQLKQDEGTNPNGAKLMMDGLPITGDGRSIKLKHGQIITKTLEVYAGESYDYENIALNLASPCDPYSAAKCTFSVHFMPVSCPVNISAPHDKWVMNTLSPQDSAGWYLPVVIDGYDVNYKGFDHIEFQYKLSTQSDEAWVNLCSYYYNDSLYNAASGNKALISSGRIENIRFYGERDPMEQNYDLRAVSFCRHGSGFISRASTVLTGIKDTRPPRVFGDPQPVDAVLGVGDNLLLRFNEPIAGNYLDEDNNFQILGTTNNIGLTAGTSVHFDGTEASYAASQVTRSLSDKPFTIDVTVKPTSPNREEHFFEHGEDGALNIFGKTDDNRLYLDMNGVRIQSLPLSPMLSYTRVAAVYDYASAMFRFYAGTEDVTDYSSFPPLFAFGSEGPLVFGRGFDGEMIEARVWTKALTPAEIAQTNMKRLTGYEQKLLAYFPMDEGRGTTISDKANGATLVMNGANWDVEQGASMSFGYLNTLRLNSDVLSRSAIQDYTLMFWFKTWQINGRLFSAGREEQRIVNDSVIPAQGTWIGFDNGALTLRNDSLHWVAGNYGDGEWHHFVLSVNRTFNNASIFIDGNMTNTFAATQLSGLSGTMYLGGGHIGTIDDLILFEQAMPKTIIGAYDNVSPQGDEMGLIAYLPFSEMKENDNGIMELVYSGNDQRVIKDSDGNVINKVIPLVLGMEDYTTGAEDGVPEELFDKTEYPPVRDHEMLTKLKFDWTFNDDELMINLNMPIKEINKQTVYVTVRDVEDINGNPMASPVMWAAFVDKNSLKWEEKEIHLQAYDTEEGTYGVYAAAITNLSGLYHQYTIEGLPDWLTTDEPFGSIEPLGVKTLYLKYKLEVPPGAYSEIIYLTDENGLSEPIRVHYTLETVCPWTEVDDGRFDQNMSLRGQVFFENEDGVGGTYDTDESDVVAVFCQGELVGKANISFDNITNNSYVYLTIHGNSELKNKVLSFKLWRSSTGKVFKLTPPATLKFSSNTMKGYSPDVPVQLTVNPTASHQQINLHVGWNWISWNLSPTKSSPDALLTYEQGFRDGDIAKSVSERQFSVFYETDTAAGWAGTLNTMSYHNMFLVRTSAPIELSVEGKRLTDEQRYVTLAKGWNSISFLLDEVTPVQEALADYYDHATVGDVIKSKEEVAVFAENGKWEGSLRVLRPGQGYLLRRLGTGSVKMYYHPTGSSYAPEKMTERFRNPNAATNMTMIARIMANGEWTNGVLKVYVGDELAAVASPLIISPLSEASPLYFLTIQSDHIGKLRFECDGETLMPEVGTINFSADSHCGSLKAPIVLRKNDNAVYKILENDHVVIIRNNEKYSITGAKLQ